MDEGPNQAASEPAARAFLPPDTCGTAAAATTRTTTRVSDGDEKATNIETRKRKESAADDNDEVDTVPSDEVELMSILTKRVWSEDAEDVEGALNALDNLLYDFQGQESNKKNCGTAFGLGAPLAVVRVLKQHVSNANIQKIGYEVLVSLSMQVLVGRKASLLKLVAIEHVVWALDHFGASPDVVSSTCSFIGNMITDDLDNDVIGAGDLRATIFALKKHPQDSSVQYRGCYALRQLVCVTGPWGALLVVDASGIDVVISAMKNHTNDELVLDEGCMVLAELVELNLSDHRRRIIDAAGLAVLAEVIRVHKYKDDFKGIFKGPARS